jgi:hypothetical protein
MQNSYHNFKKKNIEKNTNTVIYKNRVDSFFSLGGVKNRSKKNIDNNNMSLTNTKWNRKNTKITKRKRQVICGSGNQNMLEKEGDDGMGEKMKGRSKKGKFRVGNSGLVHLSTYVYLHV